MCLMISHFGAPMQFPSRGVPHMPHLFCAYETTSFSSNYPVSMWPHFLCQGLPSEPV